MDIIGGFLFAHEFGGEQINSPLSCDAEQENMVFFLLNSSFCRHLTFTNDDLGAEFISVVKLFRTPQGLEFILKLRKLWVQVRCLTTTRKQPVESE